jgi:hypothetical protein
LPYLVVVPVDGEGLRGPTAYKIALMLTWIDMWIARVFVVVWVPHVLLYSMGDKLLLNRWADMLFWPSISVCFLLAMISLALLQRSGIRLLKLFYFDEVETRAAVGAFAAKARKWRPPWTSTP